MTLANFIPEIWAAEIAHQMENALVFGSLCNRQYEGDISGGGDRVRILEIGRLTPKAYTRGSAISYDAVDDKLQTLLIDQEYYVAPLIDDLDKRQSVSGLMEATSKEIAYALANQIDASVPALYADAGTTLDYSATGLDSGNVVEIFSEASAYLRDTAKVPRAVPLVAVVDSFTARAIEVATVNRGTPNRDVMGQGWVASNFAGFDVYESPNLTKTGTYAGANLNVKLLAFTRARAIALAIQQFPTLEATRPSNYFGDVLKSLTNWGRKVVRPSELVCINAKINVETGV